MADTPLDQRVQDAINNLTKVTTVMGATMDMLVAKEGEFLDVMERIQKKFENLATDAPTPPPTPVDPIPRNLVEDRAVQFSRHFLGKHGNSQPLLPDDLARIGLDGAVQVGLSVVLPVPLRPKRRTSAPGSSVRLA